MEKRVFLNFFRHTFKRRRITFDFSAVCRKEGRRTAPHAKTMLIAFGAQLEIEGRAFLPCRSLQCRIIQPSGLRGKGFYPWKSGYRD